MFALSILSAALLSGAYAPFAMWWLAPIAVALHMFTLKKSEHVIVNVFAFGLVFNAIALHWTSIYVGSVPWIILVVGQGLFFLPLACVKKYGVAFYPLVFLIMEEVRVRFPFGGFGWLRLAFSQADSPFRSIAAFGGASGLSAMVLVFSWVLFALLSSRTFGVLIPTMPLLLLLIPITMTSSGKISTVMIQGDVPQLGLDFNKRATAVFYKHVAQSQKALKENSSVDFLLWPENAVDVDPFTNSKVSASLNSLQKPIILGAVIRKNSAFQNVSIAWTNMYQDVYVKQHLTPFGEYIPLRSIAEKISPYTDGVVDFTPGNAPKIFAIKGARIAPVICFELIDDGILETAANNSNLIVVQTNSATFGRSSESAQQLAITRIRAIEHGRNILSVSTTGISASIDYNGDILAKTKMHTSAHIFASPALISSQTPRDKAGDWALGASLSWLIIPVVLDRRSRTKRR